MKDYFYINNYDGLLYKKREDTTLIRYIFENSKLKYSDLCTPIANKRRLVNWLNERYIYLGEVNGIAVYMSVDLKTSIGLSTIKDEDDNLYSMARYMESSYNSNAKSFNFGNTAVQKPNNMEYLKVFNNMLKIATK